MLAVPSSSPSSQATTRPALQTNGRRFRDLLIRLPAPADHPVSPPVSLSWTRPLRLSSFLRSCSLCPRLCSAHVPLLLCIMRGRERRADQKEHERRSESSEGGPADTLFFQSEFPLQANVIHRLCRRHASHASATSSTAAAFCNTHTRIRKEKESARGSLFLG